MDYEIGALRDDEIEPLSAFLTRGFGTAADALFAAPDVLRWKYLTPRGDPGEIVPRSLVARDPSGSIVGHVGFAPTNFHVWSEPDAQPRVHAAVHMIDWLGSPEYKGVGGALLRRVNALAPIQYGLGGTGAGRSVIKGAGFEAWPSVPVFQSVLRPSYSLRDATGASLWQRVARVARDEYRHFLMSAKRPRRIKLASPRRLAQFAVGFDRDKSVCGASVIESRPATGALNALLAFPRGGQTAWFLVPPDFYSLRVPALPLGIIGIVPRGGVCVGKINDAFMPTRDVESWQFAYRGLRDEVKKQGADFALACGSTPWEAAALRAEGFRHAFDLELSIRDRSKLLPKDAPIHVSFLDADYAYLP